MTTAADRICSAMVRLLDREPFDRISVKELINEAGVSRSAYNYNFFSLSDVVDTVIDSMVNTLSNMLEESFARSSDPDGSGYRGYETIFTHVHDCRDTIRILNNAGFLNRIREKLVDAMVDLYSRYEFIAVDREGNRTVLSDGMEYKLRNVENAYRIVGEVMFWSQYEYNLPVEYMASVSDNCRSLRLIAARPKDKR